MTDTIQRRYWTISMAARQLGQSASCLRYWEEYFGLQIHKVHGHRRYTNQDLAKLWEIVVMVKDGHTLAGTKQMIEDKVVGANNWQYGFCE